MSLQQCCPIRRIGQETGGPLQEHASQPGSPLEMGSSAPSVSPPSVRLRGGISGHIVGQVGVDGLLPLLLGDPRGPLQPEDGADHGE